MTRFNPSLHRRMQPAPKPKKKFHIKKNGEPGVCTAPSGKCPLGENGETVEHYDTAAEATAAFEKKMQDELLPANKSKKDLGLKDLNNLAKFTDDPEVIDEAIFRGSERVLKNLAKNKNLNADQISQVYDKTNNLKTKELASEHSQYPVSKMTGDEIVTLYSKSRSWDNDYRRDLLSDDDIADEHISALQESKENPDYARTINNTNNHLSDEKVYELAHQNSGNLHAALKTNRFPLNEIKDLDSRLVFHGNIKSTDNPKVLKSYSDWVLSHPIKTPYDQANSREVASNPNTPPESLDSFANAGLNKVEVALNPNTDESTRAYLEKTSPEAASAIRFAKLDKETGGLQKALTLDNSEGSPTGYPYGRNRGYSVTTIHVNKQKVKELGLSNQDVLKAFHAEAYNAGASYNEETGIFSGSIDSSD